MVQESSSPDHILARLVFDALQHGADELDIEYKDGREEVFAVKGAMGLGIASLDSSGEEATTLRKQLYAVVRKGKTIRVQRARYRLTATVYDSFGEDAFRVTIRRGPSRSSQRPS